MLQPELKIVTESLLAENARETPIQASSWKFGGNQNRQKSIDVEEQKKQVGWAEERSPTQYQVILQSFL